MLLSKNLTPLKAAAKVKIDAEAEAVRGQFITLGSGQAMVYMEKRLEAEDVCANPAMNDWAAVPHIGREAELSGISLLDQAAIILTMAEHWKGVSSMIEKIRLAAKNAVDAATNPAEIETAAAVDWSAIIPAN